jgi:DNA-binding protein H-NS
MSQTYKELLQQREALEQAIAAARKNEISNALAKVRELVAEYGLTAQDIFPSRGVKASSTKSVPPNTVIQPRVKLGQDVAKHLNGSKGLTVVRL